MIDDRRPWLETRDGQSLLALLRFGILVACSYSFMIIAASSLEKINAADAARRCVEHFPSTIWRLTICRPFVAPIFYQESLRYLWTPLLGLIAAFLAGAYYVLDVYVIPNLRDASRYVFSSLTTIKLPVLKVDKGDKQLLRGKTNLVDAIGGPGKVMIRPGNAVLFRHLRFPTEIRIGQNYTLAPFERVGAIVNLDEQHSHKGQPGQEVRALTRDGIQVSVKDIRFRYRVSPAIENGRPARRSLTDPYPFDMNALWNSAYALTVEEKGLETWRAAVERVVVGGITDFINEHTIDYLTAPREERQDPRRELRHSLFFGDSRMGLRRLGAELIWVDIGHFAIDEEMVDDERAGVWASRWVGNAQVTRAFGEARRQAYQELARAEAQAELVMSIAEELTKADLANDPAGNLRKILLVRTAQILEAMTETGESRRG